MQSEKNSIEKADTLPVIALPIIVEGRYDKSAILGMFSANVITTDGFGVFNSKEKQQLIRRIAGKRGVILLTDSDGGGKQIRSFLTSILPPDKIYQLYVPRIEGKEKRKKHASKEGILGVEGVGGDVIRSVLSKFVVRDGETYEYLSSGAGLTPAELFSLGLSGGDGSQVARDRVAQRLSLPGGMSSKAFLAAVNIAVSREEFFAAITEKTDE